jgi:hypothetical protein
MINEPKNKKSGVNVLPSKDEPLDPTSQPTPPPDLNTAITTTKNVENKISTINLGKIVLTSAIPEFVLTDDEETNSGLRLRMKRVLALPKLLATLNPRKMYYIVNGQLAPTKELVETLANFLTGYVVEQQSISYEKSSFDPNIIVCKVTVEDIYNHVKVSGIAEEEIEKTQKSGELYKQAHPLRSAYSKAVRNALIQILPKDVLELTLHAYRQLDKQQRS